MRYRPNSILALIPPNPDGLIILKQALYFQKALEMRIFALHILPKTSFLYHMFQSRKMILIKNDAKQKLTDYIKQNLQKEIPNKLIPRIQIGNWCATLIKESKKGGYDFILLDKHVNILRRSKINKLINRSLCPVLLINKDFPVSKIKKIVIPIDISQTTKKRLFWATILSKKFDAQIKIVSALNINIEETKSLAFKNADKIKKMLTDRGVKCEIKILKVHNQQKHKVILNYIEEEKPELVIIRSHQESIFADKRIGQFVSEIVHGCNMPVFTVSHSTKPIYLDDLK